MRSSENISWFPDIALKDRMAVGGKGGSLGELTRAGVGVPPGFVVRTAAFECFLDALEKEEPVRSSVAALGDHELGRIKSVSERMRARFENSPLPQALQAEIFSAHAALCGEGTNLPLAVRSSATTEDAEDASFAGLQDTYLWVTGAQATLHSVRACWASIYSVASIAYRRKRGIPEDKVAMAVVVQRMVDARSSGVMFTRSPLTGDRSVITIEGAWGLGSAVVSGEVTPDRFVIAKITGEISVREIRDKHVRHAPAPDGGTMEVETSEDIRHIPCVSDEELTALRDLAGKVERHYGRPQDIEWAIDQSGKIFLLQSRPETVWSSRDRVPVAKPEANPLQHVMKIFGGRR
ncbi:MAG TPA: PEP/pyruvate-binding domain-containing protein [Candidatus Acidoferrum sp.]|nr:PEP/pyruvate-binding domain-containing protein [Candidatus Acidoferrum sp.]